MRTRLAAHGYDDAKLSTARARVAELQEAMQQQDSAKGAAQQATREQHEALQALHDWVMTYLKIARVALQDSPELLEKLGITARNNRTAAQRAAPAKAKATRLANKLQAAA